MTKESGAKQHEQQALSPIPTTDADVSPNGASPKDSIADKTINDLGEVLVEEAKKSLPELVGWLFQKSKGLPPWGWRIIFLLLLILSGAGSYFVGSHSSPSSSPSPSPSPSPAKFSTLLERVDTAGYCQSLGYNYTQSHDGFCFSDIALNTVCSALYQDKTDLSFKLRNPQNPYTGICYNSQGVQKSDLSLDTYCETMNRMGSNPLAVAVDDNTWQCQILVDMVAACAWENNNHDVQARKNNQGLWTCYGN